MNYTPFVLAGLLAGLGAAPGAVAQAEDPKKCGLTMYASVDLVIEKNNDVVVPVSINGTQGGMVLNTSSALSHVWQHTAKDLGLRTKRLQTAATIMFGDKSITRTATINSLKVGDGNFRKTEFVIAPVDDAPRTTEAGLPMFGGLGMEVFSHVDFELDLARRKLILFSQDHCPGRVVYWTNQYAEAPLFRGKLGEFFFPVELEGKKIEATMAPSNSNTTLNVEVTRRLYDFDMDSPGVQREPDSDPKNPTAHYRAMKLTAPGLTVRDTKIRLTSKKLDCTLQTRRGKSGAAGYSEPCFGTYPMQLGANVLGKLRLYFATKENIVYFSAADATK